MTFPSTTPLRPPRYKGALTQSLYVPMRDGVRLAVDLCLPRGLEPGAKLPALFAATRYWRATQLRAPFSWFMSVPDSARDFFTAYGYALLRIDMRGTGASEGDQPHPWPASDLADLYDLVEWTVQQPWSSGAVSAFGNSYQATTAEMLGACGHPAVASAFVRFNEYDVYTDIGFPGGVPDETLLKQWSDANRALDADRLPPGTGMLDRLMVRGVRPVGRAPVPQHHNVQVDSALRHITFRDDLDPEMGIRIDDVSIHTRPTAHRLDHWGSWFDAATADAVIRRFANSPRPQRAVVGAWNHGGKQQVGSHAVGQEQNPFPLRAQMAEALRFFDNPPETRSLHYYTVFENIWKSTEEWPPAGLSAAHFYFHPQGGLSQDCPGAQSLVRYPVDFSASTGKNNRWLTELDQRPVRYSAQQGLLAYVSTPLEHDLEITGYPLVTLFVKSTHTDGAFFVYLEAIDEAGETHYLSEGMLRALHRKVSTAQPPYRQFVPYHSFLRADALPLVPGETAELAFGLSPISALVRRGWRLRVAIACADKDTFVRIPADGTPEVEVLLGGEMASFIELPVKERN
jgi:uncharacterized protein